MPSLLEGALAAKIGKAFAGIFLDATLSRDSFASPNPEKPWEPGDPTTATYPCKAIHEEWGARFLAGGLVLAGERKVLILASTLATEPQPGDRITIRGETFIVAQAGSASQPPVSTDPAKATWTLRASA
jgi:hypothetical protein